MWTYNKTLQYPINIKNSNPQLAKFIISQYGGPDAIMILLRKNNFNFSQTYKSSTLATYGLGNL